MTFLNIGAARVWLGGLLNRKGPISCKTWRGMIEQGMPVGSIAGSKMISTDAVQAWLDSRIGLPLESSPMSHKGSSRTEPPAVRRGRGRPKRTPE